MRFAGKAQPDWPAANVTGEQIAWSAGRNGERLTIEHNLRGLWKKGHKRPRATKQWEEMVMTSCTTRGFGRRDHCRISVVVGNGSRFP